jgi:Flp pilus assembly protein TadD
VDSDNAEVHNNLGSALIARGQVDEAISHYQKALQIQPDFADVHNNLGVALGTCGQLDEAAAHFSQALEIKPDYADARNNLGMAQSQHEKIVQSLARQRELLRARPDDPALLRDIAWTLATNPNASIRNGAEAIELAQRAVELSGGREPAILGVLAAAQAEAGQFAEAVETAERALALASDQNNTALAEDIKARIKLYQHKSPYHETEQFSATPSDHP